MKKKKGGCCLFSCCFPFKRKEKNDYQNLSSEDNESNYRGVSEDCMKYEKSTNRTQKNSAAQSRKQKNEVSDTDLTSCVESASSSSSSSSFRIVDKVDELETVSSMSSLIVDETKTEKDSSLSSNCNKQNKTSQKISSKVVENPTLPAISKFKNPQTKLSKIFLKDVRFSRQKLIKMLELRSHSQISFESYSIDFKFSKAVRMDSGRVEFLTHLEALFYLKAEPKPSLEKAILPSKQRFGNTKKSTAATFLTWKKIDFTEKMFLHFVQGEIMMKQDKRPKKLNLQTYAKVENQLFGQFCHTSTAFKSLTSSLRQRISKLTYSFEICRSEVVQSSSSFQPHYTSRHSLSFKSKSVEIGFPNFSDIHDDLVAKINTTYKHISFQKDETEKPKEPNSYEELIPRYIFAKFLKPVNTNMQTASVTAQTINIEPKEKINDITKPAFVLKVQRTDIITVTIYNKTPDNAPPAETCLKTSTSTALDNSIISSFCKSGGEIVKNDLSSTNLGDNFKKNINTGNGEISKELILAEENKNLNVKVSETPEFNSKQPEVKSLINKIKPLVITKTKTKQSASVIIKIQAVKTQIRKLVFYEYFATDSSPKINEGFPVSDVKPATVMRYKNSATTIQPVSSDQLSTTGCSASTCNDNLFKSQLSRNKQGMSSVIQHLTNHKQPVSSVVNKNNKIFYDFENDHLMSLIFGNTTVVLPCKLAFNIFEEIWTSFQRSNSTMLALESKTTSDEISRVLALFEYSLVITQTFSRNKTVEIKIELETATNSITLDFNKHNFSKKYQESFNESESPFYLNLGQKSNLDKAILPFNKKFDNISKHETNLEFLSHAKKKILAAHHVEAGFHRFSLADIHAGLKDKITTPYKHNSFQKDEDILEKMSEICVESELIIKPEKRPKQLSLQTYSNLEKQLLSFGNFMEHSDSYLGLPVVNNDLNYNVNSRGNRKRKSNIKNRTQTFKGNERSSFLVEQIPLRSSKSEENLSTRSFLSTKTLPSSSCSDVSIIRDNRPSQKVSKSIERSLIKLDSYNLLENLMTHDDNLIIPNEQ